MKKNRKNDHSKEVSCGYKTWLEGNTFFRPLHILYR